jgi:hypothetical protein
MGYSTFRHFLKEQFPNLRFQRDEATKSTEAATPSEPSATSTTASTASHNSSSQKQKVLKIENLPIWFLWLRIKVFLYQKLHWPFLNIAVNPVELYCDGKVVLNMVGHFGHVH